MNNTKKQKKKAEIKPRKMREAGVEEDQSSDEEDESDTDNPLEWITFIDTSLTVFAIDDSFEVRFLKSSI